MTKKIWPKILIAVTAMPIVLTVAFTSYLYITQEAMMFPGAPLPLDHQFDFEVPFEEVTVSVDGAEINGLHFQQPRPRGLIFFLHGNGGNLDSWTNNVGYYQRVNYDMYIIDYRGYGKSTGRIQSEKQLHDDVRAVWDAITPKYREQPIVIYGRSLGAALAAKLAHDVDPDLLILVSPFSSMLAMARLRYPFLPAWLVRYPLRTDQLIAGIRSPIVVVHGDRDLFIPLAHSFELAERANASAKLLVIEGAGHNDIHQFESYTKGLTNELPN